jgi:hypothetical protein
MALSSGMGLRRGKPIPLYLSEREKSELEKKSAWCKVSQVEYVRCRTFGYSFESAGGRSPKATPLIAAPDEKRDFPIPLYLSKIEKANLRKLAKQIRPPKGIPMGVYARHKTFGYLLETPQESAV